MIEVANKRTAHLSEVLRSLPKIFSVDEELILECFEGWADEQAVIMSNRITDYKYAYFQKYGVELPASELDDFVTGPEFIPTTTGD